MDYKQKLYDELKALISSPESKELECRAYLDNIKQVLFRNLYTIKSNIYSEKEFRTYSGDSDYIIVAKIKTEFGTEKKVMLVWELKAPQCSIFKTENNNNRLIPSNDLISAENQLLNYYHEIMNNDSRRAEFEICSADNIYLGGIIISCDKNKVSGTKIDEDKKNRLFTTAIDIRHKYFYDHNNIRLLTWDYILDFFKPISEENVQKSSQIHTNIVVPIYVTDVVASSTSLNE